ncbi:hypothetical protein [Virgibacillus necropolis]|uniref:Uncharacterized protein n=1 Tax=Virgibacillus necropolis TaxID=163877 RepID=A0A221MCN3_9BACI|nr:hypothetical protein [Virgibacillus necropolis]ASN05394.1 hypothetical protein CFK40_10410 [Virgibacillus necropolis]
MLGLIIAIIVFNLIAFRTNKRLTTSQIVHIWSFTVALQTLIDTYIDTGYHGYWYFSKATNFESILTLTVVVPPVNMMFLNWYPFRQSLYKGILYILCWVIVITCYEAITLLPEPWGYFNHGWWNLCYSVLVNPFLLVLVLNYYKWICKIEKLNRY